VARITVCAATLGLALSAIATLSSQARNSPTPNPEFLLRGYLDTAQDYRAGHFERARTRLSQWRKQDVLSVVGLLARMRSRLPATGYQPGVFGWNVRMVAVSTSFNIELAADQNAPAYERDFYLSVARHFLEILIAGEAPPDAERLGLAIAALLQLQLKVEDLSRYLPWATDRFPKSASLFLALGSFYELTAAQRLATAREERLISGDIADANRRAEAAYRRALSLNPRLTSAHLRLGRTLYHQARHQEARLELDSALATSSNVEEAYLAWLFLGAVEDGTGQWAAAVHAYKSAAAICVRCQSPKLGLARAYAELARLELSEAAVRDALQNTSVPSPQDPWTVYDYGQGPQLPVILNELRRSLCATD
jgi:tetratricopeptide (TPR) repeat protein